MDPLGEKIGVGGADPRFWTVALSTPRLRKICTQIKEQGLDLLQLLTDFFWKLLSFRCMGFVSSSKDHSYFGIQFVNTAVCFNAGVIFWNPSGPQYSSVSLVTTAGHY